MFCVADVLIFFCQEYYFRNYVYSCKSCCIFICFVSLSGAEHIFDKIQDKTTANFSFKKIFESVIDDFEALTKLLQAVSILKLHTGCGKVMSVFREMFRIQVFQSVNYSNETSTLFSEPRQSSEPFEISAKYINRYIHKIWEFLYTGHIFELESTVTGRSLSN